jgi:DNA adenine methylase
MISYIGGKSRMAKWICKHIPDNIETYVEVFGGAFWVYIKGDIHENPKLKEIVYNDKNRFMVNLFQCCTEPHFFNKYMEDSGIKSQNEELFYKYQEEIKNTCDLGFKDFSFDMGMKYAYIATQVFSGSKIMESKYVDLKGKYKSKFDSFRDRLLHFDTVNRLSKITKCENLDYMDCIMKYDGPNTFFYLDPPYWKTENYYSNHDFDSTDHEMMSVLLNEIMGKFALSYYYFDDLEIMYPRKEYRWTKKEYCKTAGALKGKKQNKGEELLIMNY